MGTAGDKRLTREQDDELPKLAQLPGQNVSGLIRETVKLYLKTQSLEVDTCKEERAEEGVE